MSGETSIAFNVVGIVSSLICIAQGMMRFGQPWMLTVGYVFLGLNVFLLVDNLGGVA